jgi:hypothetical protein
VRDPKPDSELERRRWFHGWAFEERSPGHKAALRHWLKTGEDEDQLWEKDRESIRKRKASLASRQDEP